MAYTSNKQLPKIRQRAAELVRNGWSARKVGRYLGYHHTAVMEWVRRARKIGYHPIPTKSSRPKSHPKQLKEEVVDKIIEIRLKHKRYAEAVYHELRNSGINVSLSSVKRTLDRNYLLKKKSPWKRYHPHVDRPKVLKRGDLVQVDTVHRMIDKKKRLYVFTLIDVYSRDTYAKAFEIMNAKTTLLFIREAEQELGFHFNMLQSDHGPEFGRWFVSQIKKNHRYSRIGRPNDNAHIERFNRTLQEECLDHVPNDVSLINQALKKYLRYYKYERLHAGINFLTPMQVV
jgi:transposase InsO family protein